MISLTRPTKNLALEKATPGVDLGILTQSLPGLQPWPLAVIASRCWARSACARKVWGKDSGHRAQVCVWAISTAQLPIGGKGRHFLCARPRVRRVFACQGSLSADVCIACSGRLHAHCSFAKNGSFPSGHTGAAFGQV